MLPKKVIVKQRVNSFGEEMGAKNKYLILDENQNKIFYAYEMSNVFFRLFFNPMRPLKIRVIYFDNSSINEKNNKDFLENLFFVIKKKFTFWFPKYYIYKNGELDGIIEVKSSSFLKYFYIYDKYEKLIFFTKGIISHPRSFKIFHNKEEFDENYNTEGKEVSLISLKFFKLKDLIKVLINGEALFVDFKSLNEYEKELILALTFVIDLEIFYR